MRQFKEALVSDIVALRETTTALAVLTDDNADSWQEAFLRNEDMLRRLSHLSSYVNCLASSDGRNEAYLREEAGLIAMRAEFGKLRVEFLRSFKETADPVFTSFIGRPALDGAQNYLNRLRQESRRSMTPEKEVLATDLGVDGIQAWGRLYDTISAKLEFDMSFPDGTHERLPISQRRSLLDNPDRRIRKAAFEGGNIAWQSVEDSVAAALNAIAGTRLTLNRHRRVDHFLDIALFQSAITRKTLDAMLNALSANLDIPRRILRLKARLAGSSDLAWFDLGAPVALDGQKALSWQHATSMVGESFLRAYPALGEFFQQHIMARHWIDWEPRPGKRPGGFCSSSMLTKESRIFMTFNGSLGDVLTLAHEAGHAYHGALMRDVRPYGRGYPMTLAETASTFGEQVLINGLLADPSFSAAQKAAILDLEIGHGAVYLLDIPVRYEFEKSFYQERAHGALSVSRLKQLMAETQQRILGDVLMAGGEDSYFWASKLHFYIAGITFYNFPYTFGYLLSRGLYAMFTQLGTDFIHSFEALLRLAGSDTAENVVRAAVGRDIEKPDFWQESIRSLEQTVARLETLLPEVLPGASTATN